jgi:hypothetical protein
MAEEIEKTRDRVKALETELATARVALAQAEAQSNADSHDFAADILKDRYGHVSQKENS